MKKKKEEDADYGFKIKLVNHTNRPTLDVMDNQTHV
jgi:hypothetical protein